MKIEFHALIAAAEERVQERVPLELSTVLADVLGGVIDVIDEENTTMHCIVVFRRLVQETSGAARFTAYEAAERAALSILEPFLNALNHERMDAARETGLINAFSVVEARALSGAVSATALAAAERVLGLLAHPSSDIRRAVFLLRAALSADAGSALEWLEAAKGIGPRVMPALLGRLLRLPPAEAKDAIETLLAGPDERSVAAARSAVQMLELQLRSVLGDEAFRRFEGMRVLRDVVVSGPSPVRRSDPGADGAGESHPPLRVQIEGNKRVEAATVASYLAFRPGDRLDGHTLQRSIEALAGAGLFSEIDVAERDGVLVIRVVENPIVNSVAFEGLKALGEDEIGDDLGMRPRSVFSPTRAQADCQRLVERYGKVGYYAAQITPVTRLLDHNKVDVVFDVDEGPFLALPEIALVGHRQLEFEVLKTAIDAAEIRWRRDFYGGAATVADYLEYHRHQLQQVYFDHGYLNCSVRMGQSTEALSFEIEEGEACRVSAVRCVSHLEQFHEPELLNAAALDSGHAFNRASVDAAYERLTTFVTGAAAEHVEIETLLHREDGDDELVVVFEIRAGAAVRIFQVEISGNERVPEAAIRHALVLKHGDQLNSERLRVLRERVAQLGVFEDVIISTTPALDSGGAVIVKVAVTEISRTADATSDLTERNLQGRGQFVRRMPTVFVPSHRTADDEGVEDVKLRASAGISVFWDSPFGPVQFDFSAPLAAETEATDAEARKQVQ